MTAEEFRLLASRDVDAEGVDSLCIVWLESAAMEQAPKVRDMMIAAIDVVRKGLA